MVINYNHEPDRLHQNLGISDERAEELKEGLVQVTENAVKSGAIVLGTKDENTGTMSTCLSRLLEQMTNIAQTTEELIYVSVQLSAVEEIAEERAREEYWRQKEQSTEKDS